MGAGGRAGAERYGVPETFPDGVIEKTGAAVFQKEFESFPVIDRRRPGDADVIHLRDAHALWQHVRTDMPVPRCHGSLRTAGALAGARYQGRYMALVTGELGRTWDAIPRTRDMR
jgi:hypothetical protein